ncbi:major facilitator transporter [Caballeronia hypogeia]|uniref:Major facilitator transporter n=1 Tax=Caballeronia hypogeia TaxID=1777140 RepID=A0A158CJY3_9BURK|nr:MFS transporter [Caballeronia hypogeia]SAK82668.1 major facilitator transporter [Caballeronia hypogeia]
MKREEAVSKTFWTPPPVDARDVSRASWTAFLAWVFAVYDFILFGTLLPEIGLHYQWSEAQQAEIATLVAIGSAVVAFFVGPVVDRFGRRTGMIATVAGAALCSGLTAAAGNAGQTVLVLVRSLAGLGYAEQTVNATYLNEMYAALDDPRMQRRKGFFFSLVQGGWPIGALVAAGLTAVLLPLVGWQGCFIFAAFPAIAILFMTRRLKESPQFLLHRRIVETARAGDNAQARDLAHAHGIELEHAGGGIGAAFRGRELRTTVVLGLAFMLNWSTIQVFSVLGTTVITKVHALSFQSSLVVLVLSNVVGYAGYVVHGFIGDRLGRRNTIVGGWTLGALSFLAMLYAPSDFGVVVAFYSLGLFFLIGPYAAALFFIGESYPTSIRATGGAIVTAMGPIGAVIASAGVTALLAHGASWKEGALYFGALPCFASALLMIFARKGGEVAEK